MFKRKWIMKDIQVYGVGINDANYQVYYRSPDNKVITCPYYRKWKDMLKRCYSEKYQSNNPAYIDCTVSYEWLVFSNFKNWMIRQDWKGKHLDKDIKITGNKRYSPEACIFVSQEINNLLTDSRAARGLHPQGVHYDKRVKKYRARCRAYSKRIHLGLFETQEAASDAYRAFKSKLISSIAENQNEPLRGYLERISDEYNTVAASSGCPKAI
jgi:hypothetical protein